MKTKTIVAVTTLLMSSGLALAAGDTQDPQSHHPKPAGTTAQPAPAGSGVPMMTMHENMQKMHAQMEEISRTEDPDKRDELIQSHIASMQEMMKMMHSGKPMMGKDGMMGQGMGMQGGKMMGGQQGDKMATPQGSMMGGQQGGMMEMMNRQQMMQQRMDMMQMMMDQMMQNQAAIEETRMIRDRRHDHRKMK